MAAKAGTKMRVLETDPLPKGSETRHASRVSADVNSLDTLAHAAQQIRSNRADAARHAIRRQYFLAIRAVDRRHIADLRAHHVRDIAHGHVHGYDPDDRHALPAQQTVATLSQRTVDSDSI